MARKLSPVHPGEVLLEEFLKPMSISQYQLAKDISVPPRLGVSERFWLNLQARYDLEVEKDRLGRRLSQEVRVFAGK